MLSHSHRTIADEANVFFDHAHNDYLEAAVEGGIIRLCAALCATRLRLRCRHAINSAIGKRPFR